MATIQRAAVVAILIGSDMCLWSAHPHGPFLGPITLWPSLSEIDSAFLQELWVACRFVVADGGPVDRFRRRIRLGMTGGNHLKGCFGRPKLATTTGNRLFLNVCGISPRRMPRHLAEAPPRHMSNDPRIPRCGHLGDTKAHRAARPFGNTDIRDFPMPAESGEHSSASRPSCQIEQRISAHCGEAGRASTLIRSSS